MGACLSADAGGATPEEAKRNKEIEKQLREAKAEEAQIARVLLLGSGDSGKTTIVKQMRIIHKTLWGPSEIESYRQLVYANIVEGMRDILVSMADFALTVSEENAANAARFMTITDLKEGTPFPRDQLAPLKALWSDPNVVQTYERANEVALPDNLAYYFSQLDRVFEPTYSPIDQDILRARARTTGMSETKFKLRGHYLHLIDVGGQKSERRKWVHFFSDVTSILFLVSLNGYDQCLMEDKDANQMQDAMAIWDSICHSQWFQETSIILFLNKTDLFDAKVQHSDIKDFFPDYEGPTQNAAEGRDYFRKRFVKLSVKNTSTKDRDVYTHFTNATDTALLRVVMAAVEDTTLKSNLTTMLL